VVDGSGLENQRSESFRGFESHPLRLVYLYPYENQSLVLRTNETMALDSY
jgi:hypothetical protein